MQNGECLSSESLSFSIKRVDEVFLSPDGDNNLRSIFKDFMKATGTSFDTVNANINTLIQQNDAWNNAVKEKVTMIDAQLEDHSSKLIFLNTQYTEVEQLGVKVELLQKTVESLQKNPPAQAHSKGGERPGGFPILLLNFPENAAQVLGELGMDRVLTSEVCQEIRRVQDGTLSITCRTGAAKYRMSCWIKSNLANLNARKIGLLKGYLEWISGKDVKEWDQLIQSKSTTWVYVPAEESKNNNVNNNVKIYSNF